MARRAALLVALLAIAIVGFSGTASAADFAINCSAPPITSGPHALIASTGSPTSDTLAISNLQNDDVVTFTAVSTNGGDRTVSFSLDSGTGTGPAPSSIPLNGNGVIGTSIFTKTSAGAAAFTVTNTAGGNNKRLLWSATCTRPVQQTLTIGGGGAGTGTTVGTPPSTISCTSTASVTSGTCANTVSDGTVVTLTAIPAAGSLFSSWTNCDSVSANVCTQTVAGSAETVTANFTPAPRTLTIAGGGTGTGTTAGTAPSTISCTSTAGTTSGTCANTVADGTVVTLTATPAAGSSFSSWSNCDSDVGNVCTQTVSGSDETVTANFAPTPRTLTIAGGGTGTGTTAGTAPSTINCTSTAGVTSGTCANTVSDGTVVTLTAIPAAGSSFSSWSNCDSVSANVCTQTVAGSDETVTANFAPTPRTLTIAGGGTGTGTTAGTAPSTINCTSTAGTTSGTCANTVSDGTVVTLTATPAAGSSFSSWSNCDSVSANVCTQTVSGSDETVTANFAPTPRMLTIAGGGTGTGTTAGTAPSTISCTSTAGTTSGTCANTVADGTVVTLTATPAAGSSFSSWSNCDSVSANVCTQTVSGSDETVTANFTPTPRTLTIAGGGTGTGTTVGTAPSTISCTSTAGVTSGTCANTVSDGTVVTLTATPAAGSSFSSWSNCDSDVGNVCTQTVSGSDETVTANFTPTPRTLTIAGGGTGTGTTAGTAPSTISCTSTAGVTSGTCANTVADGTVVTLTATPAAGSSFSSWSNCDSDVGNVCTQTVAGSDETVTANFAPTPRTLTIAGGGTGTGTTAGTAPSTINCTSTASVTSGTCANTVSDGTVVTLTAIPAAGSLFSSWTNCDSVSANVCTQTVSGSDETVTANFAPTPRTLTIAGGGTGTGTTAGTAPSTISCTSTAGTTSGTCANTVADGTVVTLTAIPAAGSLFSSWTNCDSVSANVCTQTVSGSDETVTANFAPTPRTLTIAGGGTGTGTTAGTAPSTINCTSTAGTTSGTCANTVADGTVVTLTATPAAGSSFSSWSNCDSATTNVCTQTVSGSDETVTANFAPTPRTLTIAGGGTGTGTTAGTAPSTINCTSTAGTTSGTCANTVADGTVVTLTATPAAGSTFSSWTNCDSDVGNVCTQTVSGSDETVTANFSPTPRTLTIAGGGTGTGTTAGTAPSTISCTSTAGVTSGTCANTVADGTVVTLTATPAVGSSFSSWSNCDSDVGNVCTQTVSGSDETVTANFSPTPRTLTIAGGGTGTGTTSGTAPSTINCTSTAGTTSGTCANTVADGTVVTLTATPAAGSSFSGWANCDSVSANVCTQTVAGANETVTASFTLTPRTLTIAGGGTGTGTTAGTAPSSINCTSTAGATSGTCANTVSDGTVVTLTATAAAGSSFSGWSNCDSATTNVCTQTVAGSNETVTASFTTAPRTITIAGGGTGTGTTAGTAPSTINCTSTAGATSGTCSNSVTDGTVVTLTATPAASSTFSGWTNCDSPSGNICTQTVSGSNETVTASFALIAPVTWTLTVAGGGAGNGTTVGAAPSTIGCASTAGATSGTCSNTVADGTAVTLTATPASGSTFAGWTNCGSAVGNICTQTIAGSDVTVTAAFGSATGAITLIKRTSPKLAGNGTFSYSSSNPNLNKISLKTTDNRASTTLTEPAGTYVIQEAVSETWELKSISCDGSGAQKPKIALRKRQVTIELDGAEAVTCTFTSIRSPDYVSTRTKRVISNFISRRADQITANEPNIVNRLLRPGAGGSGGPVGVTADGTRSSNQFAFSTSLQQMLASGDAAKVEQIEEYNSQMMTLGPSSLLENPYGQTSAFDIWSEGQWAHVDDETRDSDIGLLYLGADYRVKPGLLIGMMAQFDWMDETDNSQDIEVSGTGWLAGPYGVARLHDNLIFDGRLAWGQSFNEVDPLGLYTDDFDTSRWLARAQLTGDFRQGDWVINPFVRLIYFEEEQERYTDSLGISISEQTVALGRLTFGPEVSRRWQSENGTVIAPYMGIQGLWDFNKAEIVDIDTGFAAGSSEGIRGRVEGGVAAYFTNGWSVTGESFFDGIGADDLSAYGGSVRITVPLN